jgi:hypothetical protein
MEHEQYKNEDPLINFQVWSITKSISALYAYSVQAWPFIKTSNVEWAAG